MSLSPEIIVRIQAVEAKLAELDPILHEFCARSDYTFSGYVGVWPRRKVWAREEVDRTLDLITDLTVPELMERGFYPEMPFTLIASASERSTIPGRVLIQDVFHSLPFAQLAAVLAARLEEGFVILRKIRQEDIVSLGQVHGSGNY